MRQKLHDTLVRSAHAAADVLMDYWSGRTLNVREKKGAGLVSDADFESERAAISVLRRAYPDFAILTEETGTHSGERNSRGRFILDPLDGTTNYIHGFPVFCVSVAAEWDGQIVAGAIYHPVLKDLYTAIKGKGANLNGKPLHVSRTNKIEGALLSTGFSYNKKGDVLSKEMSAFKKLSNIASGIRRPGSAALDLAYVARGVFDGFWERNLSPWDMAAGMLLVTEAGGKVGNFAGKKFHIDTKEILATNGKIHNQMVKLLGSKQ
jgi:myo-inositol-1(or 4)-monophosphatase